ncbi:MAG TPA: formylglycine-generating enzyme family protein [Candidatus Latescibacteria bacterium]|nr:formylglycine-generating enzyme family protein [Candidatus Latescibacterota bacterium]
MRPYPIFLLASLYTLSCSPERGVSTTGTEEVGKFYPLKSMQFVPGGSFVMGSDGGPLDERPAHTVHLSPFMIGATEVTNGEYGLYVRLAGVPPPEDPVPGYFDDYPDHPVVNVSWIDAVLYCNWLSEAMGFEPCYTLRSGYEVDPTKVSFDPSKDGFHLPTEAQWEYAASGGEDVEYPWGDGEEKLRGNSSEYEGPFSAERLRFSGPLGPLPVGRIGTVGRFSLADVGGNVWEWCNDFYKTDYYRTSPGEDPLGPGRRDFKRSEWNAIPPKVVRGGGYNSPASRMRCSARWSLPGTERRPYVGFRIAREVR